MYTVTPDIAVARADAASLGSDDTNDDEGLEYSMPVPTPARRPRQRPRVCGFFGCGVCLLTVFLVLFLCMARQPFLRLYSIELKVDNTTKASKLIEKYDLYNENYYSMSWERMQLRQDFCSEETCDSTVTTSLGTAYINKTIHQGPLSTRRIEFDFDVTAANTARIKLTCQRDKYFWLLMMGHAETKLFLSGNVGVNMGPELYRVDCDAFDG